MSEKVGDRSKNNLIGRMVKTFVLYLLEQCKRKDIFFCDDVNSRCSVFPNFMLSWFETAITIG